MSPLPKHLDVDLVPQLHLTGMFAARSRSFLRYFPPLFPKRVQLRQDVQPDSLDTQSSHPYKVDSPPLWDDAPPERRTNRMADPSVPILSPPPYKSQTKKDAGKFDVIAAYKNFVNDPDVSWSQERI